MQQPRKEPPDLLTKAQACEALGVSPRTLDNLIAGGKIAHTYVPGRTRTVVVFSPAEVERVRLEREERLHVGVVTEDGAGSQALARREPRNLAKHAEATGDGLRSIADFPALVGVLNTFVGFPPFRSCCLRSAGR
ncbi:MAG TPA: helix-turn-helix domain-containing protein [Blastocatellia bacterium]|jgi:Helix-turn-helix domain|nr:helix-turn-helix domain-containing protein [Blastocatellia bacterium]